MNVLKVNYRNRDAGAFIAIPSAGEIPNTAASFALVQTCRVEDNNAVLFNPADALHWNTNAVANRIKLETLDVGTGWFVDNLLLNPAQDNCLYYMTSFPADDQPLILQAVRDDGNVEGGTLFGPNAVPAPVTAQAFGQYRQRTVVVGAQPWAQHYPMLVDLAAGHPAERKLRFEVHLVYLGIVGGVLNVGISNGFRWTAATLQESRFDGFAVPNPVFRNRVAAAIAVQNQVNGTDWQLP